MADLFDSLKKEPTQEKSGDLFDTMKKTDEFDSLSTTAVAEPPRDLAGSGEYGYSMDEYKGIETGVDDGPMANTAHIKDFVLSPNELKELGKSWWKEDLANDAGMSDHYKDREGQEIIDRSKWALTYMGTLGGNVGPKGMKEKLEAQAEKFSGLGSIMMPATVETARSAIMWAYVYPAMFKGADKIAIGISRLPLVKQATSFIAKSGGMQKLVEKFPKVMLSIKDALGAAERGAMVGGTVSGVETIGKDMGLQESLKHTAKGAGTMAGVATVFSGASSIDKANRIKGLKLQLKQKLEAEMTGRINKIDASNASAKGKSGAVKGLQGIKERGEKYIQEILDAELARLYKVKSGSLYKNTRDADQGANKAIDQFLEHGLKSMGKTNFKKAPNALRDKGIRSFIQEQRAKAEADVASGKPKRVKRGKSVLEWLQAQADVPESSKRIDDLNARSRELQGESAPKAGRTGRQQIKNQKKAEKVGNYAAKLKAEGQAEGTIRNVSDVADTTVRTAQTKVGKVVKQGTPPHSEQFTGKKTTPRGTKAEAPKSKLHKLAENLSFQERLKINTGPIYDHLTKNGLSKEETQKATFEIKTGIPIEEARKNNEDLGIDPDHNGLPTVRYEHEHGVSYGNLQRFGDKERPNGNERKLGKVIDIELLDEDDAEGINSSDYHQVYSYKDSAPRVKSFKRRKGIKDSLGKGLRQWYGTARQKGGLKEFLRIVGENQEDDGGNTLDSGKKSPVIKGGRAFEARIKEQGYKDAEHFYKVVNKAKGYEDAPDLPLLQGQAPKPKPAEKAETVLKHFTTPEGKKALEGGQDFNHGLKPIHGTGSHSKDEKVNRFMGDRIYLSMEDAAWDTTTSYEPTGEPARPATLEDIEKLKKGEIEGQTYYDYEKQDWMLEPGTKKTTKLSPVEYKIAGDAKTFVIDSMDSLQKALDGGYFDNDEVWNKLAKKYDILILKDVSKLAEETDHKFFRAAKGDQAIVLNKDKVSVVKPPSKYDTPKGDEFSPAEKKLIKDGKYTADQLREDPGLAIVGSGSLPVKMPDKPEIAEKAGKLQYSSANPEYFDATIKNFVDHGKNGVKLPKGIRLKGASGRMTRGFDWLSEFTEIPNNLVNTKVMKRIKELTNEYKGVTRSKSKGGGYYLIPHKVKDIIVAEFGKGWDEKRPDRERSPKQALNDTILKGEFEMKKGRVIPPEIGQALVEQIKEIKKEKGVTIGRGDLSAKARKYIKEYLNERSSKKNLQRTQESVRGKIQDSPDTERKAIQEEADYEYEAGSFLDGLYPEEAPKAKYTFFEINKGDRVKVQSPDLKNPAMATVTDSRPLVKNQLGERRISVHYDKDTGGGHQNLPIENILENETADKRIAQIADKKTSKSLEGKDLVELEGGTTGKQKDMFDKEDFLTQAEREKKNSKGDVKGQDKLFSEPERKPVVVKKPAKAKKQPERPYEDGTGYDHLTPDQVDGYANEILGPAAEIINEDYAFFMWPDPYQQKVNAETVAKESGELLTQEEANKRVNGWKNAAKTTSIKPGGNLIISLFDRTGEWSKPYKDAGYNVLQVDVTNDWDLNIFDITPDWLVDNGFEDCDGILCAPPCTDFSGSGARWWAEKDKAGATDKSKAIVEHTIDVIEWLKPHFWALENPVGRIGKITGIGTPTMQFHPHNYGDPYTKRTQLWGNFNTDLPQANVHPSEGSKIHNLRGDNPEQKAQRSITPEGFAYSFFMANPGRRDLSIPRDEATKPEAIDMAATRLKSTGEVFTAGKEALHDKTTTAAIKGKYGDNVPKDIEDYTDFEDGFTTNTGRFVGREEAAKIAGVKTKKLDAKDLQNPALDWNKPIDKILAGQYGKTGWIKQGENVFYVDEKGDVSLLEYESYRSNVENGGKTLDKIDSFTNEYAFLSKIGKEAILPKFSNQINTVAEAKARIAVAFPNVSADEITAVVALWEANADVQGITADEWVKRNIDEIRAGGDLPGGALQQIGFAGLSPIQKRALNRQLKKMKDGKRLGKYLKAHAGTPWEKNTVEALLVRADLELVIKGKDPKYKSYLGARSTAKSRNMIKKNGKEGIWMYILDTPGRFIGHPEKPANAINASYANCTPSTACAKFCYAVNGHNWPRNIVKSELINWAIETDPVRAAKLVARQYKGTPEFEANKALRIYDRGEGSELWLPFFKELNKGGVRVQVFSKKPALLRKINPYNVRLLSVDSSNLSLGRKNLDLGLAFVYAGSADIAYIEENKERFEKHGGVILPVNLKKGAILSKELLNLLPKWAEDYTCPVDAGLKSLKGHDNYHCGQCDKNGGVGCYYGQTASQVQKNLETPLSEYSDLDARVEKLRSLLKGNSDEAGRKLLEELDNIISENSKGIAVEETEADGIHDVRSTEIYKQRIDSITKAAVSFLDDGSATIYGFEQGDLSSLAHETGHIFRRQLSPKSLKAAEKDLGVVDGKWTLEQEEAFARGFERYLRTGNAPSENLADLFTQFKDWLVKIYKKLKGSPLEAKVSPELKTVFDSLLAAGPAVADPAGASGSGMAASPASAISGYGTIANNEEANTEAATTNHRQLNKELPDRFNPISEFLDIASPAHKSPIARDAGRVLRARTGELAQKDVVAARLLRKAHRAFAFMSRGDMLDFVNRLETGRKQKTEKLQKIADIFRKLFDQRREQIQGLGKGYLENFYENYFPHMWKDSNKASRMIARIIGRKSLKGPKSFLKKRTIVTINDGIEAGLELFSNNPVDIALLKLHEMDRFLMAHGIIRDLKDRGLLKFVYARSKRKIEGYSEIDDYGFTVYMPPEITKKEAYDSVLVDQLIDLAKSLGIDMQRFAAIGGKRLGYAVKGHGPKREGEKVRTRAFTPESVIAHELGHIIGFRYGVFEQFRRVRDGSYKTISRGKNAGDQKFVPTKDAVEHRKLIDKQWRDLADARKARKAYARKKEEKEAVLLQAYVHSPDEFKKLAPDLYKLFVNFLNSHSELRPILDLKTSLQLGQSDVTIKIPGVTELGKYYAPTDAAKIINNYLSPGLRGNRNKLIAGSYNLLRGIGNVINQAQLAWSFFHGLNVTTDMMSSTLGLGLREITTKGQFVSGVGHIVQTPISPIVSIWNGARIRKAYETEILQIKDPHLRQIVQSIIVAGGRDRMDPFYYNKQIKALTNTAADIVKGSMLEKAKGAARLPFNIVGSFFELGAKPLMEWYVPNGKLGLFSKLAVHEMKRAEAGQITRDQLWERLVQSWDNVDNRMGQLVYDNLAWNKILKDVSMLAVRSVGWNLGSWREYGGIPIDILTTPARLKRGDKVLSQKMAYGIGSIMVYGIISAAIMYILTGKWPHEYKDYFFPKTGGTNPDGSEERLSLPTYAKDWFAWSDDPIRTAKSKLHPMWSAMADIATNKDFFNTQIRNPDDPFVEQAKDLAAHIGKQFLSISVRNYQKFRKAGHEVGDAAWVSVTGITSAPSYLTRSPAQKLAYRYWIDRMPDSSKTQEEADRRTYKKDTVNRLRKGDSIDVDEAKKILGEQSFKMAVKEAEKEPFEVLFGKMSLKEALNVYLVTNEKEAQLALPILKGKYKRARIITPDMEQLYQEILKQEPKQEPRPAPRPGFVPFSQATPEPITDKLADLKSKGTLNETENRRKRIYAKAEVRINILKRGLARQGISQATREKLNYKIEEISKEIEDIVASVEVIDALEKA